MNKPPLFNIGDKVQRTDFTEQKTHTIEKIREHRGNWIYSMDGQGWGGGWLWVDECDIRVSGPVIQWRGC